MGIISAPAAFKGLWLAFTANLVMKGLSGKPKNKALETGKPATLTERGSQLPVLIGRAKLGPLFAWEGPHTYTYEPASTGGKGIGTGSGGNPNQVFFADGVHFLCVGPAWRLRSIKENGEIIWPLPGTLPNGITRTSHPSGSVLGTTIPTGAIANNGNFTIYWGDDPPVTSPPTTHWDLYRQATGVQSDWPFCCGVFWKDKRLGGSEVWGILEYDVECEPYSTLSSSNGWVSNGEALSTDIAHVRTVLRYIGPVAGVEVRSQLWIQGNHTGAGAGFTNLYPTGGRFQLRNSLVGLDGDYVSDESVWEPTIQVIIPNSAYDQLVLDDWDATTWLVDDCTIALAASQTGPPGYVTGVSGDSNVWRVTRTSSNHTYACGDVIDAALNADPSNGDDGDDIGTDVCSLTLYVDLATAPAGLPGDGIWFGLRSAAITDIGTNEVAWAKINRPSGTFVATIGVESQSYFNAGAFWIASFDRFPQAGTTWYRLTVNFQCPSGGIGNFDENSKYAWIIRVNQQAFIGSTGAPPLNFLVVDTVYNSSFDPTFVCLARRVPIATPITGITRLYVTDNMASGIAFRGRVTPYLPDSDGTAGANPAHILDQLIFAADPHGLGRNPAQYDIDSLEQLGVDYEEVRAHALVEQRQVVKQIVSDVCTDVGIDMTHSPITGKITFKKRREESPFAVIPRDMLVSELPSRLKKLESDPAKSFVFTWLQAQDNYSKGSLEIDDLGNILSAARAGAEIINLPSVRDFQTARILAGYRSAYEISRGSIISFKLKNDAATLMPGDVIDVEALTDIDVPFRLITTSRQPLESSVKVTGYFDHMNVEDAFVLELQGARNLQPETPVQPEEDFARATYQQLDGTWLFLRIPSHPDALSAALIVSTDATSYWGIGTVPACAGGEIMEDFPSLTDEEDGFYFKQPAGSFAAVLPQLPAGSVVEGVLRLLTEEREIIYFRELESFGDNVWRVKGMLRAQETTSAVAMDAGQRIWIWQNGAMPSFVNNLPTTGTPSYKLVPYTHRRTADASTIADIPI